MDKKHLSFLQELSKTISPSGFEEEAVGVWKDYVQKSAGRVKVDVHGNAICGINTEAKRKIMLCGHIDEIGYMLKYIDDKGFIYFSLIGGIDPQIIPGRQVLIKGRRGRVLGIIGRKPVHLMSNEDLGKKIKIEDLWIDIGAKSKKEALNLVSIGDVAVPFAEFANLENSNITGRGFDDKAGAFVTARVLEDLAKAKLNCSVWGVATVQEEIGLRGARTSAYGISPDIGIAVDVTFASDYPGIDKRKTGEIFIGKGPVIAKGPNIHPKVFAGLVEAAEKNKIPFQVEAIPRATGTDANVIQLTKSGVAAGLVSIPLRYMHTPVEIVNTKDLDNTILLIEAFIKKCRNLKIS